MFGLYESALTQLTLGNIAMLFIGANTYLSGYCQENGAPIASANRFWNFYGEPPNRWYYDLYSRRVTCIWQFQGDSRRENWST